MCATHDTRSPVFRVLMCVHKLHYCVHFSALLSVILLKFRESATSELCGGSLLSMLAVYVSLCVTTETNCHAR